MKTKRTISMILMSVFLAGMLSFSAYAAFGYAYASGEYAEASVSAELESTGYIEVYATMGNVSGWVRDEYNGVASSAYAYVSADQLSEDGPPQAARACGWIDDELVCEDYWTD